MPGQRAGRPRSGADRLNTSQASQAAQATGVSIPCTSAAFAELSVQILLAGRALRFRASGGSMSPLVRDGDVVLVRPVEPSSVEVGDVVLCASPAGRVVVHRVVARLDSPAGPRFTVQGDQVVKPDGIIPAAQVYGRVAAVERAGARIDMDGPAIRWLGRLAVLRSRFGLGRGGRLSVARRLIKRLPFVSRYLA